jgi:hypothetical protein
MANTIIDFLPPTSPARKKYEEDIKKTEKTFNLPQKTIRRPSSGGGSRPPTPSTPTPSQPQPQSKPEEKPVPLKPKPQAQTIQSQIKAEPSGVATAYNPLTFYRSAPERTTKLQAFGRATKQFITGQFSKVIPTLEESERVKGDRPVFDYTPRTGTIQIDPMTGKEKPRTETVREKELKKEQDRQLKVMLERTRAEREEQKAFETAQRRIDKGEDTEIVRADYSKKVEGINKKFVSVQKEQDPFDTTIAQRTGTTRKVISGVETGVVVGATLISPVAGAAVGGALLTRGAVKTLKPTPKQEIIAEGGLFGSIGRDPETGKLKEQSPLLQKVKQQRVEGLVEIGTGALILGTSSRAISKAAEIKAQKEILTKQTPEFTLGITKTREGQQKLLLLGQRKTPDLQLQTVQSFTVEGTAVKKGVAGSKLFAGQKEIARDKLTFFGQTFDAKSPIIPRKAKVSDGIIQLSRPAKETVKPSFGRVQFLDDDLKASREVFGGLARPTTFRGQRVIEITGGKLKGGIVRDKTKDIFLQDLTTKGRSIDFFKTQGYTMKGRFTPENIGIIKEVRTAPSTSMITGSVTGRTQTLQKTAQQYQQSLVTGLQTEKKLAQTIKLPTQKPKLTPLFRPSTVMEQRQTFAPRTFRPSAITKQEQFKTSQAFQPFKQIDTRTRRATLSSVRSDVAFGQVLSPRTASISLSRLGTKSQTIQSQLLKQTSQTTQPLTARQIWGRPVKGLGIFGAVKLPSAQLGLGRVGKGQRRTQVTGYQPSFTGSVLNLRLEGSKKSPLLGALKIRGIA